MSTPPQLKLLMLFAQFFCTLSCAVFFEFYDTQAQCILHSHYATNVTLIEYNPYDMSSVSSKQSVASFLTLNHWHHVLLVPFLFSWLFEFHLKIQKYWFFSMYIFKFVSSYLTTFQFQHHQNSFQHNIIKITPLVISIVLQYLNDYIVK